MKKTEKTYNSLMSTETIKGLSTEKALQHITILTDLSFDLGKSEGLHHSLRLSGELQKRSMSDEQLARSHYFLANAWSNLKILNRDGNDKSWEWEQEEIERALFHLRTALRADSLPDDILCPVLTNLGNLMNEIGRTVEAIEYWDRALNILPSFAMAKGGRGIGFSYYARSLYDTGHYGVLLKYAHINIQEALQGSDLHNGAIESFTRTGKWIVSVISPDNKALDMEAFSLGDSDSEIMYRKWCLENKLFLNPLNDLGSYPIAATDVFTVPSIVVEIGEGPYYHAYFNQMKQEYVSARYLYYTSTKTVGPHFSDKDVKLYNTMDYPAYSLAVEKMKASYRMIYSLFDKIAFYLNHYLTLAVQEKQVSFKTIWYKSRKRDKGLRDDIKRRQNWPLRGLFWLSKDLYEDKPGFRDSLQPDAKQLTEIRNHLEHKYLKLHEDMWMGLSEKDHEVIPAFADILSFSMYRKDFQEKTLRLIKMARAALIYLSLAIHWEERMREQNRDPNILVPGMFMGDFEDDWKR